MRILRLWALFWWLLNGAASPGRGQNPPPPPPPQVVFPGSSEEGGYDFRDPEDPGSAPLIDLRGPGAPNPSDAVSGGTKDFLPEKPPEQGQPTRQANDIRIGEEKVNARIVEEPQMENSLVYPDDPESAWWETNVRYAFGRAQREMKPLLLLFTATWSEPAMHLSQEVFATKSFNEYVKQNLVICYLVYPQNISDASPSMRWAKEEFKVSGYPSVLIFNPKGEVVRSLRSYRKGRPVDYFNELKQVCAPVLANIEEQKSSLSGAGYRMWRNPEGRSLFAKFVRRDDLLMTLKDGRAQEWTIAINQLSEEDQKIAMTFPRLDQVLPLESR